MFSRSKSENRVFFLIKKNIHGLRCFFWGTSTSSSPCAEAIVGALSKCTKLNRTPSDWLEPQIEPLLRSESHRKSGVNDVLGEKLSIQKNRWNFWMNLEKGIDFGWMFLKLWFWRIWTWSWKIVVDIYQLPVVQDILCFFLLLRNSLSCRSSEAPLEIRRCDIEKPTIQDSSGQIRVGKLTTLLSVDFGNLLAFHPSPRIPLCLRGNMKKFRYRIFEAKKHDEIRWETPCLFGRSNLASGRQVVPRWWLTSGKLNQLRLIVYPIIYRGFIHARLLGISSINSGLRFWAVWNRILSWEHAGAFRQTSLDELLPVDDCAENYKGRQRKGELETAFLIALISGWSGEKQENKQKKGSWMKSNCKILDRYLTPQKSHWEIESQMMQLSDGAAALLLPKMLRTAPNGKKWHNNGHPGGNERQNFGPKSWALEKVYKIFQGVLNGW